MRETGTNPKRAHIEARGQIGKVLRRWNRSPEGYAEVPETLAGYISSYADDKHGADGWKSGGERPETG